MELEESIFLISEYTTKLHSSRQYGTGRKTETQTNGTRQKTRKTHTHTYGILSLTREARLCERERCSVMCKTLQPHALYSTWNSPGQNTGVGSLQPVPSPRGLPNPGVEPRSPTMQQVLYQLSHKESPRILDWVAYPFFSRSSQPRYQTGVLCIAGGFFTN